MLGRVLDMYEHVWIYISILYHQHFSFATIFFNVDYSVLEQAYSNRHICSRTQRRRRVKMYWDTAKVWKI